ncbi:hypothetical protein EJB05_10122 [Eragrostis curvula]|uniref:Secreted protein n=1 Tax=Eragrostis curvula TaxID=38414 RepID=A0A5J9W6N7_9POAL|nr:hypothetical protein EJB05_10122 [Eragrostis curvula]
MPTLLLLRDLLDVLLSRGILRCFLRVQQNALDGSGGLQAWVTLTAARCRKGILVLGSLLSLKHQRCVFLSTSTSERPDVSSRHVDIKFSFVPVVIDGNYIVIISETLKSFVCSNFHSGAVMKVTNSEMTTTTW